MECVFCRILNGEIPCFKLYEDEHIIAILDISQATRGHTLLIAKEHYKNLYDINEDVAANIFRQVPKIANAIKRAFNPIGLNVIINTEKPLQTVFHFHLHLIPRYHHDGVDIDFINNQGNTSHATYLEIQEKIQAELK
ncbi:MAG: HIT family protein [Candidatus Izemoplasmatales bacterium]|nr:HIT family protein [Candidatus Izemoplasmatales bacterium]MDD5293905.1 HIT family protein [Candidatus Izemoplasmatales bacterium]